MFPSIATHIAKPLSRTEYEMIALLLGEAGDEFAEHSANDLSVANTSENASIHEAIARHQDPTAKCTATIPITADGEILMRDYCAMRYFSYRCQLLAETAEPPQNLTAAELEVVSELLLLIHECHVERADLTCQDISWPASAETAELFQAATDATEALVTSYSDPQLSSEFCERASEVRSGLHRAEVDEYDIPDFWILYYLGQKFHALATQSL